MIDRLARSLPDPWAWTATQAFLVIFSLMLLGVMGGFLAGVVCG